MYTKRQDLSTGIIEEREVRPPLSKKSFPVRRDTAKKASREVGNFFFFPLFLTFHWLECTKKIEKKKLFSKTMGKKVPVGPF